MQSEDLIAFNALLSRSHVSPLQVSPSGLIDPRCKFTAPAAPGQASVEK